MGNVSDSVLMDKGSNPLLDAKLKHTNKMKLRTPLKKLSDQIKHHLAHLDNKSPEFDTCLKIHSQVMDMMCYERQIIQKAFMEGQIDELNKQLKQPCYDKSDDRFFEENYETERAAYAN